MPIDKPITPEEFWDLFSKELSDKINKDENLRINYNINEKWTGFMYELLKEISIKLQFKDNGHEITKEYFRIDYGFFSHKDHYIWDFEVAIEHENNDSDWLYEFMKLVHINTGLKVIITYHNFNYQNLDEKLAEAFKNYMNCKYKKEDNWLLIFGPVAGIKDKDFVAYEFTGNTPPIQLTEKKILLK